MHDDDSGKPKPLAVGLIHRSGRTQDQIDRLKGDIAMKALAEGYALLFTYEAGDEDYETTLNKLLVSVRMAREKQELAKVIYLPSRADLGKDDSLQLYRRETFDQNELQVELLK